MKWGPICAIRKDDGFCRTGTAKECAFTEFIQGFCHFSTVRFEQAHFETLIEIHAALTDCVLCARFTARALCVCVCSDKMHRWLKLLRAERLRVPVSCQVATRKPEATYRLRIQCHKICQKS